MFDRGVMSTPTCPVCGRTCGRTHGLEWTLGVRGVVRRGALATCVPRRARGRHTAPNRDLTATKRGNCTNRGATRRREASNAAKPPSPARDTPRRSGRRVGEYGRASRHGPSHGTRGRRPDNLQTNVARNFPRSLFEITRKRCNSNDVDSTFELIAWELRATLMGGGRAWPSIETRA